MSHSTTSGRKARGPGEALGTVVGDLDLVPAELERLAQAVGRVDVVLDDRARAGSRARRGRLAARRRGRPRGSVERQPHDELGPAARPVAVRAHLAAVQLHQALHQRQPEAQPALAAVERRSACMNGSKSRGSISGVIPTPGVGDPEHGAPLRRVLAERRRRRRPPAGVNFAAFWSRLPTTCASRVASPSTRQRLVRRSATRASIPLRLEERAMVLDRAPHERRSAPAAGAGAGSCRAMMRVTSRRSSTRRASWPICRSMTSCARCACSPPGAARSRT